MSQYKCAEVIFNSSEGVKVQELMRKFNIVESSCRTSLLKLQKKELIVERDKEYFPHPEATEEDLERIRPKTISELQDSE
jgi:predicted DNA-binding transcriptional regulator